MKHLALIFALALSACAGTSLDQPDPATTPDPAPAADGVYFSHLIGHYEGCQIALSTDPDVVQLRGPSCTADGSVCEDIANNRVEVWQTAAAETGSPFGSAGYVQVNPCDAPDAAGR